MPSQVRTLYGPASATKPVDGLRGDHSQLSDFPDDPRRSDTERLGIQLFGSAAKIKRCWVALCMRDVARAVGVPGNEPYLSPQLWPVVNETHKTVIAFRGLVSLGLAEIVNGYGHPTQKLVDMIMMSPR